MKGSSSRMAFCAVSTALGVVLMMVLGWTGFGTYIAPLLAAGLVGAAEKRWGPLWALVVWAATGLLALILVSDLDLVLTYLLVLGWYPILRSKLPEKGLKTVLIKLITMNAAFLVYDRVFMLLIGMTEEERSLIWVLLILGNLIFWLWDQRLYPVILEKIEKLVSRM